LNTPTDITHTYVLNSNVAGEIRFQNLAKQAHVLGFPPGTPYYKVKVDIDVASAGETDRDLAWTQ
jgi:hypothetical protein